MKNNILPLAAFALFLTVSTVSGVAQETQQVPEEGGYPSPK